MVKLRGWRARAAVAGAIVLTLLLCDWSRPPERQLSARFLLGAIAQYQAHLSPWLPSLGVRCRFQPTCSRYAQAVIARDGALKGSARAAWRILRCGPWTPRGTRDEP